MTSWKTKERDKKGDKIKDKQGDQTNLIKNIKRRSTLHIRTIRGNHSVLMNDLDDA